MRLIHPRYTVLRREIVLPNPRCPEIVLAHAMADSPSLGFFFVFAVGSSILFSPVTWRGADLEWMY